MTNFVIFFVSVALFPSKITVKTAKTVFAKIPYNPNRLGVLIKKSAKDTPWKNSNIIYFINLEKKIVMSRHNGFFDVFLCGTLTSLILVQFNIINIFYSSTYELVWDCKPAFSVLSWIKYGRLINEKNLLHSKLA